MTDPTFTDADLAVAREAVHSAHQAFRQMLDVSDAQISSFFRTFADRLADDAIWDVIADANASDVERAQRSGRSTTRLVAGESMRNAMVEGLLGWEKAPSRRGEVIERREGPDWTIERRRAAVGVVAFVFEGRPNVFADGSGVLRGGNTAVLRIGSDALGTAEAIDANALAPALEANGLPSGAVTLVRSTSHGVAQALFTVPDVRLAIARGSGATVRLLGSIAARHGIPVSLHGTGGAWMYLADDADPATVRNAIVNSLDRKVCNTLNTLVIAARKAHEFVPLAIDAVVGAVIHVANGSHHEVPSGLVHRVDVIPVEDLKREWEWEKTPEFSIVVARDDDEAIELINTHSPRFVASIITADGARFERFYERVDAPYVGDGFTRWVDGQWAWDRPELGLSNWERGRILGRSGILSGEDVFTVRDVFRDSTGRAPQSR
jgi:glutamate-5-semialdehyde dehydrogenase